MSVDTSVEVSGSVKQCQGRVSECRARAQGRSRFDLSSAPQLRKVDLLHRVGAQCRRSTPAALQLADVDFSQPAAAHMSTAPVQAVPRRLVDHAITSKPPELADAYTHSQVTSEVEPHPLCADPLGTGLWATMTKMWDINNVPS